MPDSDPKRRPTDVCGKNINTAATRDTYDPGSRRSSSRKCRATFFKLTVQPTTSLPFVQWGERIDFVCLRSGAAVLVRRSGPAIEFTTPTKLPRHCLTFYSCRGFVAPFTVTPIGGSEIKQPE